VHLQDYGCSLKAFRATAIKNVRLYGEMHRFIPAWLATVTTPRKIAQEVVTHHARMFGESKYGISRTFRVILDLIFVYFFMRFRTRPGHFFGGIGLGLGALGLLILAYLTGLKLFTGASIGTRPMFFGGFFFVIAGIQMVTTGVLAELLTRVYFESGQSQAYVARERRRWPTPKAGTARPPEPHERNPVCRRLAGTFLGRLIFALPLFSFLLCLGGAPLFDVDEGAFSEATREMFERGDFLFTYLNGAPLRQADLHLLAAVTGLPGLRGQRVGLPAALGAGRHRVELRHLALRPRALRP
jgi:hypothetical protein